MYEFIRNPEEATDGLYWYGMRLRGYSPGAQPKGVVARRDDKKGKYHDILWYKHELSERECQDYELDYIGTMIIHDEYGEFDNVG